MTMLASSMLRRALKQRRRTPGKAVDAFGLGRDKYAFGSIPMAEAKTPV
jgi:hypothetical protein